MGGNWSNVKILIVENTESGTIFFKSAFKRTGVTILTTVNGKQAIETVKNNPDIDITNKDIHMYEMNGL